VLCRALSRARERGAQRGEERGDLHSQRLAVSAGCSALWLHHAEGSAPADKRKTIKTERVERELVKQRF
jgi:hypothetical protein